MNERGIALLVVLWVLAGIGTAAGLGLETMREGIATSRVRTETIRARWAADGCLARTRARLDRNLGERNDAWRDAKRSVPAACVVEFKAPADLAADINTASADALRSLPGFDSAVVAAVVSARDWGRRIEGLDGLLTMLPADLREQIATRYADLVGRVAFEPPAWDVVAFGMTQEDVATAGPALHPAVIERWVRAGTRVAVVRRVLP